MAWALMIFFIFITVVFVIIALMFPEWVGITGKKALEIQKHQSGDEPSNAEANSNELTGEPTNELASSAPSAEKKRP